MKKIVFTFGRYNPPTTGHAELINYTVRLAQKKGADHRIYTSQSHDPSKNPLSPRQKMTFLRQIFPGVNFVDDPSMKTAFAIAKKLANEGYEDVTFVVGEDRVREFSVQLGKYVKPRTDKDFDPKKHYPFKHFQVVSSGARKKGISGTDLRAAVRRGDFATFAKASAARDRKMAREIFAATRSQLKEQALNEDMTRKEFDGHLKSFMKFTAEKLGFDELPKVIYKEPDDHGDQPSFGGYSPDEKKLIVMTKNRHPMDIFRTVAHELVHHKQNLDGRLGKDIKQEGSTGSDIENEANSEAGKVMRWFGKSNPDMFGKSFVIENEQLDELDIKTLTSYSKQAKSERRDLNKYRFYDSQKEKERDNRKFKNRGVGLNRAEDKIEKWKEAQKPTPGQKRTAIWAEKRKIKDPVERKNTHFSGGGRYVSKIHEGHAILLGGVPGSGKDKVLKEAILPHGFKELSQENFRVEDCTGENLVINGTMSGYEQTRQIKNILESAGYKTMMVFVNTSDEVSRQRNEARAVKGGRVIAENVRFSKWQTAQVNLEKYDRLFEKVIEVRNDFDVNNIADTWSKLMESVSKEIVEFTLSDADRKFENMLNEVGGAGNWGTPQLTRRYQKDTPGQTIGFRPMKVLSFKNKMKTNEKKPQEPSLQISADRIGQEVGFAKSPGFGTPFDDFSVGISPSVINDPVGRWMVKEETRRMFKEKYGKLAEQKIRETANRLRKESLIDPYAGGGQGMTPNSGNVEDMRPDPNAEDEKTSLFRKRKRLNNKR